MAKSFLDTNIFFYAVDAKDPVKQAKSRELIARLVASGEGVVSTQVIQEFANNMLKKLGFTPDQTLLLSEALTEHTVIAQDIDLVRNALQTMKTASISFWDASIVAAAERCHCKVLFTEDHNNGQRIGGVKIVNPFA